MLAARPCGLVVNLSKCAIQLKVVHEVCISSNVKQSYNTETKARNKKKAIPHESRDTRSIKP